MTNESPTSHGSLDVAADLAAEHDARTLAAALVERLRADGRGELVAAVVSMLEAAGIIVVGPGNPHTPPTDGGT